MIRVRLRDGGLERILARRNMTQNCFARRAGISSGYLSQLIRNQRHPSPRVRQAIMEKLEGVEFDELFEEAGGS